MRLIDADALKKDLKSVTLSNGTLVNTNAVLYLLEEYPTAFLRLVQVSLPHSTDIRHPPSRSIMYISGKPVPAYP